MITLIDAEKAFLKVMTQYKCVSCLVIAIIVAFVMVIHVQCLVSVYLSLVKIKYSVCVWKKKKKRTKSIKIVLIVTVVELLRQVNSPDLQ